jgi:hypothetical protein
MRVVAVSAASSTSTSAVRFRSGTAMGMAPAARLAIG